MRRRSLTWLSRSICSYTTPTIGLNLNNSSPFLAYISHLLSTPHQTTRERGSYLDKEESKILRRAIILQNIRVVPSGNSLALESDFSRLKYIEAMPLVEEINIYRSLSSRKRNLQIGKSIRLMNR